MTKRNRTNTGENGVTFRESRNRYEAWFLVKGQKFHVGTYKSLSEAVTQRAAFITSLI